MKFYVAWGYRRNPTPDDICICRDTYEEAKRISIEYAGENFDPMVFVNVHRRWYCVLCRDPKTGRLWVSADYINYTQRFLSDWY